MNELNNTALVVVMACLFVLGAVVGFLLGRDDDFLK